MYRERKIYCNIPEHEILYGQVEARGDFLNSYPDAFEYPHIGQQTEWISMKFTIRRPSKSYCMCMVAIMYE